MKSKSREYTRELTEKQILDLKRKYSNHVKVTRDGFLNTKTKERLLHITKWSEETQDRDVYDFFYEIRQRAYSAIRDFQLLCDTLNEEQLEEIFATKETYEVPEDKRKFTTVRYPITELMNSLIPYPLFARPQQKEIMDEIKKKQEWRKYILEDLVIESLLWYFHSGIFKINAQKMLLFDTIDAISVMSSDKKQYELSTDPHTSGLSIVKF